MPEWLDIPTYPTCFVCGEENPIGLKMKFRSKGKIIEADYNPLPEHCGYSGIVHGGIVSAIFDESMGWTAFLSFHKYYLTMELKVRFRKPVESGRKYLLRCEFLRKVGNVFMTKGELIDSDGVVVAESEAKYYLVDKEFIFKSGQ